MSRKQLLINQSYNACLTSGVVYSNEYKNKLVFVASGGGETTEKQSKTSSFSNRLKRLMTKAKTQLSDL